MATIGSSLQIYDRMSGPLNSINNALSKVLVNFQDMQTAAGESVDLSGIEEALNQTNKIRNQIDGITASVRKSAQEQEEYGRRVSESAEKVENLKNKVLSLAAAYVSIQGVGKVLGISDELTQTTSRLDMMNDGLQTTDELVKMVYGAAQDARGSFGDMASVVARFGNNAKDAFSSSAEVVQFANLVQKQMTIAGASTQEAANAELQLSQALGSGVLRGDELNSIFEQAPNLIQNIADYLDVPIGQIREMAADGELSADVVKAAVFAAADDINEKFESMPMTFGQIATQMQNTALMAFQPVLQRLNATANSEAFQEITDSVINSIAELANIAAQAFDLMTSAAGFVYNNWSLLSPVITGIAVALGAYVVVLGAYNAAQAISNALKTAAAIRESVHAAALAMQTGATFSATAAQYGFNAALLACPLTWIVVGIIAVIAVINLAVAAFNKFTGASVSGAGVIAGTISVLGAVVYNAAIMVWNIFAALAAFTYNALVTVHNTIAAVAEFFTNVWNHPVYSTKKLFVDLLECILNFGISAAECFDKVATGLANAFIMGANIAIQGINWIIGAINHIPGVKIDTVGSIETTDSVASGAISSMESMKAGLQDWLGDMPEDYNVVERMGMRTAGDTQLEYKDLADAYNTGYDWGANLTNNDKGSSAGSALKGYEDLFNNLALPDAAASNISAIADDTKAIRSSTTSSDEELKYLRQLAEREAVNRFTTAEIKIDMTNNNTLNNEADVDGIVSSLETKLYQSMKIAAEGK